MLPFGLCGAVPHAHGGLHDRGRLHGVVRSHDPRASPPRRQGRFKPRDLREGVPEGTLELHSRREAGSFASSAVDLRWSRGGQLRRLKASHATK